MDEILTVALAIVGAAAQQATAPQIGAERHVKDIKGEQTNQKILPARYFARHYVMLVLALILGLLGGGFASRLIRPAVLSPQRDIGSNGR